LITTSVNTLNLCLQHSLIARILQLIVAWGILWAILASPAPLVFALSFLGSIVSVPAGLFYREYTGVLRLRPEGRVTIGHTSDEKQTVRIGHVATLFSPLMVRITLSNQSSIRIWRDSCCERDYRRLLVALRAMDSRGSRDSSPLS
jgi:hypothetical protein